MDYFVIGDDGTEYGPANLSTLGIWVKEGRVLASTKLKSFSSGTIVTAGSLTELFPPVAAAPTSGSSPPGPFAKPPTNYPRVGVPGPQLKAYDGSVDVWWSIGRSVVGVIFAIVSPGAGLFICAYGVWRGVRAYQAQHRLGLVALVISIVAMLIVASLFLWRIGHPRVGGYANPSSQYGSGPQTP